MVSPVVSIAVSIILKLLFGFKLTPISSTAGDTNSKPSIYSDFFESFFRLNFFTKNLPKSSNISATVVVTAFRKSESPWNQFHNSSNKKVIPKNMRKSLTYPKIELISLSIVTNAPLNIYKALVTITYEKFQTLPSL